MSKNKYPKYIWGARVNLSGCYSDKPVKCKLDIEYMDENDPEWKSADGYLSIKRGLHAGERHADFGSENKEEVEFFLMGVESTMRLLRVWASEHLDA